jgi:thymidylate synthase
VRNLLANPQVRYLVILNGTQEDRNAGGCGCLLDLLHRGVDWGTSEMQRPCWVIRSDVKGYVDPEIPVWDLDLLRRSIQWCQTDSIAETITQVQAFSHYPTLPPWSEPKTFPISEPQPSTLPGPRYGHRIEGATIAQTWVKIIHRIKTTGVVRANRYGGQWQELIDLVAVVTDEPEDFYFPEPNYLSCDRSFVQNYIDNLLLDVPEREGIEYTYGQRLRSWFGRDQIDQVVERLSQDINSTRAVMTLWDVGDYDRHDNPCLNHIWLRVVDQELSLTATFRSNDMFSAWPANAMGLRALQCTIRDQIIQHTPQTLHLGPLITISQSAHIYDDTWDNADKLIREQYGPLCRDRTFIDPTGNFLLEVTDQEIVIYQTTPGSGEVVKTYRGKNPLVLIRQLCDHCPTLEPGHAGYLGLELQKAATCLKTGTPYIQDR